MTKEEREFLLRRIAGVAREQGDVISRDQLMALGVDHRFVAAQVAAGRWQLHGRQTVAVVTGPLGELAQRWRAIWEVGSTIAQLDGVTALQHEGLTGFNDDRVWISVLHTHTAVSDGNVIVRKVRRRVVDERRGSGIPRARPEIAAVRGATWAVSDRQAALILVMAVQQRLTTGDLLVEASIKVRRRARRALIHRVALDIADGAHSLGELDFGELCRKYGIPAPSRQAVRNGPKGRIYLDAAWEDIGWAVEIDGAHHFWGLTPTDDSFRQNEIMLSDERLLRMTLIGLRLEEDRFMDQVRRAHMGLAPQAA